MSVQDSFVDLKGALTAKELSIYFATMYFKISMRNNPQTGKIDGYYRLVESHQNEGDRVCHRTILSAGFLDELKSEQLNQIQKILTAKVSNLGTPAFGPARLLGGQYREASTQGMLSLEVN